METQARRLNLHEKLCDILGSRNVYYQPPESIKMKYPCIVYHRTANRTYRADNVKYMHRDSYTVTYISKNPDDDVPDNLEQSFDYIRRENRYVGDGLYHDPYFLYYKGGTK